MSLFGLPILGLITFLPVAGVVLVACMPSSRPDLVRRAALGTALVVWVLSLLLLAAFASGQAGFQYKEAFDWIPSFGIQYKVGVDGLSLLMVVLTTTLTWISILASFGPIKDRVKGYMISFLVLEVGMIGVFVALDLFLFYIFWEIVLVPMYLIIGIWGGQRRLYASLKFFIYTMLGSMPMLVAILYIGVRTGDPFGRPSFSYDWILAHATFNGPTTLWLFAAFFVAFAVKVPIWPFHTWLPDAHVEAPTAGSVVLASIMLKVGTFGFLRFAVPLFPGVASYPPVRFAILTLAVIGIVYGALVAMVQPDFKKLVAYSSVSHLGFVMLGIFAMTVQSVQGALFVNLAHGVSTGALFLLVGMMYERRHSRLLDDYGGIAKVMPVFATILTIVSFSSIGVPGTNGFVGEFLVLVGSFRTQPIFALIASTAVIFAAAYLLWALQRIIYNPLTKPENKILPDLNWREIGLLLPLLFAIVWLGVYPAPVLDRTREAAARFVHRVETSSLNLGLGPNVEIR